MEHVRTQLPYGLLVAGLALALAYLPSALGLAPVRSFILALSAMACFLAGLGRRGKTHQP